MTETVYPSDKTMKALVLVAHPDDEVLFAGNLILAYRNVEWTIISATGNEERTRRLHLAGTAFEQHGGCNIARVASCNLPDDGTTVPLHHLAGWEHGILETLDGYEPEIVFTHNPRGEYGHPAHMLVGNIARRLWQGKGTPATPVWSFLCEAPSAVGPQTRMRQVTTMRGREASKRWVMEQAYPDELAGLGKNQPELLDVLAPGAEEKFTGDGRWIYK